MKVLFIGGTGIISSACSRVAVERGIDLYHLRRGKTARVIPEQIGLIEADIRDPASAAAALAAHQFDAVVDFIAFTPEHIAADVELFRGRTAQFVFISSASAYEKPPSRVPVTEKTPLDNPYWAYSRAKIACESALLHASANGDFPVTIVRPSHTYDATLLPWHGGYTLIARLRQNKPIVVHGDGTSLWTLTHHHDFARAFVALLGNPRAAGEAFHITSDEWLSWNQIHVLLARALGAEPKLVHVPSDLIAEHDPEWGAGLLGDKAHSMLFDNAKIKSFVPGWRAEIPFERGAPEIAAHYASNAASYSVDAQLDATIDRLIELVSART
jgi:nucleoside-diphosphate-sugar epimerase